MKHVKPELALVAVHTAATTYSFRTTGEGFRSWALCTVNDATGELLITSDWGSWSHRWNTSPESLGHATLTAFIGDRADVDYLARKLQREGTKGRVFSAQATAKELRKRLCERRREDGRNQVEYRLEPDDYVKGKVPSRLRGDYTEDGLPIMSASYGAWGFASGRERLPYLTRDRARAIWNAIGGVADELGEGEHSAVAFYDRIPAIDGFRDYVTREPWEYGQTVQTHEDMALRDIVLPALIAACKTHGKARLSAQEAVRTVAQGALLELAKRLLGAGAGIDEDTETFTRINALTELVVKQLAPVATRLPERKEWAPTPHRVQEGDLYESSEVVAATAACWYVNGWNEALDAVERSLPSAAPEISDLDLRKLCGIWLDCQTAIARGGDLVQQVYQSRAELVARIYQAACGREINASLGGAEENVGKDGL